MIPAALCKSFNFFFGTELSCWVIRIANKKDFCSLKNLIRKCLYVFLFGIFGSCSHDFALHFIFPESGPWDKDLIPFFNYTFNYKPDDFRRTITWNNILWSYSEPYKPCSSTPKLQIPIIWILLKFSDTLFENAIKV